MAISYINKKALEKDVEKYLKTFAEAYADTAANEITKFAQQAIQRFYDHYTPKYYDRTDDLKKNSFSKYKHNKSILWRSKNINLQYESLCCWWFK